MKRIIEINPISDPRWVGFINNYDKVNIFHHPSWMKTIRSQYGLQIISVCYEENNEILCGIPFAKVQYRRDNIKWVSFPFSDYSCPFYVDKSHLQITLNYLTELCKRGKASSIEIRSALECDSEFVKIQDSVLHTKELHGNLDDIFLTFKKTQVQQPIKKAQRDGVKAYVSNDENALEIFYDLHLRTRKKLGVPIQPRRLFKFIFEEIIKTGFGFIVIVNKENLNIGAGLFAYYGKTLTYKFGASHPDHLKLRPNNLMLWTAFGECVRRGLKYIDFGKTDTANEGLREFKAGWGSEEKPLYYSYYPELPQKENLSIISRKIIKPLIKNSPLFVCRAIGELFYRYTA